MNQIDAQITKIETHEALTIVTFATQEHQLKMMSLELREDVQETSQVTLRTKATNIAIAKELQGMLSYSNQLKVSIESIDMGRLLCSVKLLFEDAVLESIITADSAKRMQLKVGENVTALIKSSDLAIAELLS